MFGAGENTVLAYIYNEEGKYGPALVLSVNPIQVASFLVMTKEASKVLITDHYDEMELCTLRGGFIDRCRDQKFLGERLLPILIPMQQGQESPQPLEINGWDWSSEEVNQLGGKDGVIKWYNNLFNTQLIIK